MADTRSPYQKRLDAGEVVTPGLIDWGGIINAFNAPYNEKNGRLPDGPQPAPGKKGDVTAYYNAGFSGPADEKTYRARPSDPSQSRYVAEPRFASASSPSPQEIGQELASRGSAAGIQRGTGPANRGPGARPSSAKPVNVAGMPSGSVMNGKDQSQLAYGQPLTLGGGQPALAAIDNIAPLSDPTAGAKPSYNKLVPAGMPVNSRSRDSLAYAQAGRNAVANMPPITAGATGMFGIPMSPGMNRSLAGQQVANLIPGVSGAMRRPLQSVQSPVVQQGIQAAQQLAAKPAITEVGGGGAYTTTSSQQNNFQTTPGALMPASTNNSRWTTGY